MKLILPMQLLLALIATLTISLKSSATTVVAIVLPDRVMLAADGKMVITQLGSTFSQTTNKIYKANKYYFGCAGFFKITGKQFEAIEITKRYFSKDGRNPIGDISDYKAEIIATYKAMLLKAKPSSPFLADDVGLFQCIITGITLEGEAFARQLSFSIRDKKAIEKEIDVTDETILASQTSWARPYRLCIGACERIAVYKFPTRFTPSNVHKKIKLLVEVEIKNNPDRVGPPIAVLEMTRSSSRFLSGKGNE
jgi:hypothetical protein